MKAVLIGTERYCGFVSEKQNKASKSQSDVIYSERLYFSAKLWLLLLGFALIFYISIWAALGNLPAIVSTVLLIFLFVIFNFKTSTIRVSDKNLKVGFANIEITHLGEIQPIADFSKFQRAEVVLDPAAYLHTKFWIKPAVKINLSDPKDPTPFWLFSTRDPVKLTAAIRKAKE